MANSKMILAELQNRLGSDFPPWIFLRPSRFLALGICHIHEKLNRVHCSSGNFSGFPQSQKPHGVSWGSLLAVEKTSKLTLFTGKKPNQTNKTWMKLNTGFRVPNAQKPSTGKAVVLHRNSSRQTSCSPQTRPWWALTSPASSCTRQQHPRSAPLGWCCTALRRQPCPARLLALVNENSEPERGTTSL